MLKFPAVPALIIGVLFFASAYLLLSDKTEPLKNKQHSLSAVFKLVSDEIVKPLRTAEVMARAHGLDILMNNTNIEHQAMLDKVAELSSKLQINFFVASENSRRQYNADGTWIELIEGQVEWYFRAREKNQNVIVSLGQRENVHIYYDLKIVDESGKFLGFIGVSKDLDVFLQAFERYHNTLGYDFVFVAENQDVMLSSNATQMADGTRILSVTELDWYQTLSPEQKNGSSLNNAIVSVENKFFQIIELELSQLNWKLYLLTPVISGSAAQAYSLTLKTAVILTAIIIVFLAIPLLMLHLGKKEPNNSEADRISKFPSRMHLLKHFDQIRKEQKPVCLILVDIDQFQLFNDNYGRQMGDKMLLDISHILESNMRMGDAVARWGEGDEFVILLPGTDLNRANAIAELLRTKIANHKVEFNGTGVSVSASFGLTYTQHASTIERLVSYADDALYQAKRDGQSMIRMQVMDIA